MMTNIKEIFLQCEYPYYKGVEVHDHLLTCTLYSIYSNYKKRITLNIAEEEHMVHQVAIEIIKFRSEEMWH